MRRRVVWSFAVFAVALALSSCGGGTEPASPATISIGAPSLELVAVGASQQLTPIVLDQHGDTMSGVTVAWTSNNAAVATVTSGGLVTTHAVGTVTLTASAGAAHLNLPCVVTSGSILRNAGDAQVASGGLALASVIQVRVADALNLPAANVPVVFAVTGGGGTVTTPALLTNAAGFASTVWTLGASGSQSATATVAGLAPVAFGAYAVGPPQPGFQITVINVGPPLIPAVQAAFDAAVAFWQRAITGDLPDIANFSLTAGSFCGNPRALGPFTIDDVVILARFDSIDGPGKILGQAGPCVVRSSAIPSAGGMTFDTADVAGLVASGHLNDVIRHEMGHVLGFGTVWGSVQGFGCLQNPSSAGNLVDTYYNCGRGRTVFDSIGGITYSGGNKVPLENCVGIAGCGGGTYNSHWRESVFFNELMTGYLNNGTPNPMSVLTLASMQDLGYVVNLAAAEPYSRVFTAPHGAAALRPADALDLSNDILVMPIRVVDSQGRLQRVLQP